VAQKSRSHKLRMRLALLFSCPCRTTGWVSTRWTAACDDQTAPHAQFLVTRPVTFGHIKNHPCAIVQSEPPLRQQE
jgi:hypothetical protein